MELILLSTRIVYWIFIAPIWWCANMLASIFYPYEGDGRFFALSLVFFTIMASGICALLYFLFSSPIILPLPDQPPSP